MRRKIRRIDWWEEIATFTRTTTNYSVLRKFLLIIFLCSQLAHANDSVEISIITCSPGKEVYTIFGHSAIRIVKKSSEIDQVYNFGMFDFQTPGFTFKFLKGKLEYYLGTKSTKSFINEYTNEGRIISEQVLNLNTAEKSTIINQLLFLHQPENKFYLYAFLNKNCATELRDLLEKTGIQFKDELLEQSYRELMKPYLVESPWYKLGLNLILGKSLDEKVMRNASIFLPDYFEKEVNSATLNGKKIVKSSAVLNSIPPVDKNNLHLLFSPLIVFSVLAVLFIFWMPTPLKIIVCLLIGMIGLIILTLWLFSDHPELKNNLNILWCNPLYLIYIPLLLRKKSSTVLTGTLALGMLAAAIVWIFQIQNFDIALIPLLAITGIIHFKEIRSMLIRRRQYE